ncbi:MAG: hypothetical protein ABIR96_11140 [Bdellovibrionota bacterium]
MNTNIFVTLAALGALGLSACKAVEVDSNGAIPNHYVSSLEQFEGTYSGNLKISYSANASAQPLALSKNFKVALSSVGNRPVISTNIDVLGAACGSSVGKLVSLEVGGAWDFIAKFAFDPGTCADRASGRYVVFYGSEKNALVTLYRDSRMSNRPGQTSVTSEYRASLKKL